MCPLNKQTEFQEEEQKESEAFLLSLFVPYFQVFFFTVLLKLLKQTSELFQSCF